MKHFLCLIWTVTISRLQSRNTNLETRHSVETSRKKLGRFANWVVANSYCGITNCNLGLQLQLLVAMELLTEVADAGTWCSPGLCWCPDGVLSVSWCLFNRWSGDTVNIVTNWCQKNVLLWVGGVTTWCHTVSTFSVIALEREGIIG